MRKTQLVLLVLGLLVTEPAIAQQHTPFAGDRIATVMTRNVYHGVNAEINGITTATSFPDLLAKVAAVYNGYHTRNFPERAERLADEIWATQPELIGLQEAILVRTGPFNNPAPATNVDLDYVQILLDALAARGLNYEVVVSAIGFDAELPSALGFDVRHTDREVLLARSDLATADLKLSNAQAGDFVANCQIPGGLLGPITIQRGWVAVDAKIRGKMFRLISTHLDGDCLPVTSAIQQAQANEILAGPGSTTLPLILLGDLNARADGSNATYNNLVAAGFVDAWTEAGSGDGFTWSQADDLLNPISMLDQRIDLVLFRGDFEVTEVDVLGEDPSDKTPSGLWPSDHAGVAARLLILPRTM
jgi:endonuclease/exonuclease/phosphatase family metal-dependent hydrolase